MGTYGSGDEVKRDISKLKAILMTKTEVEIVLFHNSLRPESHVYISAGIRRLFVKRVNNIFVSATKRINIERDAYRQTVSSLRFDSRKYH